VKNVNAFIIKAKRTSTQNKCSQSYSLGFATASSMKRWLKHGSPIEALGDDKKRRVQGVRKAKGQRLGMTAKFSSMDVSVSLV